MKARYLTFFSYIGTKFRSSEKLWIKGGSRYEDPESVQGMMEISLLKFKPLNYPKVVLSSRTDGGVHALNASAHFDLERYGEKIYDSSFLTYKMNKYFYRKNTSISIKQCFQVNNDFHARFHAKSRTYLFRFAVLKPDIVFDENKSIASFIPIEEWRRCFFFRIEEFDIEKFKEGAKYFVGYHDFTTFKKFDKLTQNKQNRREIKSIVVKPSVPCVTCYSSKQESYFDYWDVVIEGRSFVHNQIRRMIGTLISVAKGQLEAKDIKVMLQIPSKHSWHTFIQNCPSDGLYLCNIGYQPEDLIYNPNKSVKTVIENEFVE